MSRKLKNIWKYVIELEKLIDLDWTRYSKAWVDEWLILKIWI
jgi:hypothetical protein